MYSFRNLAVFKSLWAQKLLLIVIGGLYPLGFSPIDFWPLTVFSMALLFNELIAKAESAATPSANQEKKLSFYSIVFYWSIGAFGIGVSWVYVSIHEFGHVPIVGAIAISFLLVLTLSVIKAFGGFLVGRLAEKLGLKMLLMIFPFIWVVFEFVQTSIFSGFPWLFAGYTQVDGPLWKLSTWLGVYGVSWFLVAITTCLVFIIRTKLKQNAENGHKENNHLEVKALSQHHLIIVLLLLASGPVLSLIVTNQTIELKKESIKVALVQPNIPQEQKWDRRYFSKILEVLYSQTDPYWKSELIIWPEGAIPAHKHQVEDIVADLNQKATKSGTDMLFGLPIYQKEQDISYSALISVGKENHTYHKQVLVPFGEYVPLGNYLRGLIQFLNLPMSSFSPATSAQQAMEFENYQVIPAICYEITYPGIVHKLVTDAENQSDKTNLLVTVSNDAWFGDSLGPYQHMQMARMRALELGMPLVRSTNDGITAVVDANGEVLKKLDRYQQQTLVYDLPLTSYQTPYRKFGLTGVYFLLLLNGLVLLVSFLKSRR